MKGSGGWDSAVVKNDGFGKWSKTGPLHNLVTLYRIN